MPSLIDEAKAARENAVAPFSKFKVGAALRTKQGKVYRGCNVENASYGLTCCAERNAVFGAVLEGERSFLAVAVVTETDTPTPPCGACRQVLMEFAQNGDMHVILATLGGDRRLTTLNTLLPLSFRKITPTVG